MKTHALRLCFLSGLTLVSAFAQSNVQTQRTVSTPPPTTETRTVLIDGKPATERVTTTVVRETESTTKTYKAAIFITNRGGPELDPKISSLEDYITSQVTDLGFNVLTRELVVDSLRKFDPAVASKPRPADGLDAQLTEQSSALRLAQNMGVDYIIQASIAGLSSQENKIDAYGVKMTNQERTLRVTYKIVDASGGGSLTGDTVRVKKTFQQTANSGTDTAGLIDEMLDEAAQQITSGLKVRVAQNRIAAAAPKAAFVSVNISVEAADMMIPDVRIGVENTVSIGESKFKLAPLNASVEVDGVTVGTAPGKVSLRPGFAKLRITREGFKPWERTVNAVEGQTLTVALAMSEDGYARWKDATEFINALKNGAKLTDAQVKVLEGKAKMLSESFSKISGAPGTTNLIIPGLRF
jgi:hypothetical protein